MYHTDNKAQYGPKSPSQSRCECKVEQQAILSDLFIRLCCFGVVGMLHFLVQQPDIKCNTHVRNNCVRFSVSVSLVHIIRDCELSCLYVFY